jgi:hypothetical protein
MQAMIEPAAIYTKSIYKCKGCPPQNQCTLLQFFIRNLAGVGRTLLSVAFDLDFV